MIKRGFELLASCTIHVLPNIVKEEIYFHSEWCLSETWRYCAFYNLSTFWL